MNYPKRGIGDTTVAKLVVAAGEHNVSLWEVVSDINRYFEGRASRGIQDFVTLIKSFKMELERGADAHDVALLVAKSTGILRELHADKTVEGLARYDNLQELLNSIKQFVDSEENEDKSLPAFLQTVSLLTTADQEDEDGDHDRVTLMTIHGSKGLEFKHVFVVGLEENLFPSQMMLNNRADLEEERRLFYVAITRAEQQLTLSYADSRYNWGRLTYCEPSRFLLEIDEQYLDIPQTPARTPKHFSDDEDVIQTFKQRESPPAGGISVKAKTLSNLKPVTPPARQAESHTPSSDFKPSNPTELKAGQRVEHPKFGFGKITRLESMGASPKATVEFETQGEKTLLLSFAKLRVVEE